MPIKGITEQRRLPRLGHLRLGIKATSKNGKEYPKEVDYFVLDPKTPDPEWNEELKKKFKELYGDKPKAIKIMFPPVAPELFFSQWYKRYGSSTLVKCKGDGEIATTSEEFAEGLEKVGDDERGFIQVKCQGPECPYQKSKQCSRMASLQVILPELEGVGIWQVNTGSYNSIVNINSAIAWLQGLTGRYAMIPVILMRVPTDIPYEGKRSKHYILQVDQRSFSIGDIQSFAVLNPPERALISAPDESKDALFYDAEGKKIEKPAETQEEAAPATIVEAEVEVHTEVKDAVEDEKTGSNDEKGPMAAGMESLKIKNELKAAIFALTSPKGIIAYTKELKESGVYGSLLPMHQDELKKEVELYLETLKK